MMALLFALTLVLAAGLTRFLFSTRSPFTLLDHPNERSLHQAPTPRTGGVAIVLALAVGALLIPLIAPAPSPPGGWSLAVGAVLIALLSLADDWRPLSAKLRLAIHIIAASLLLVGGFSPASLAIPLWGSVTLGWGGSVLALLFVVWFTNLYNFMDGMDGFAGGMGLFGFGALALFGALAHAPYFTSLALIITGANLGFLLFNFPPARIFMGDVGSTTMGFLAAALTLWGVRDGLFPLWVPLLAFSPFLIDATVVVTRRLLQGEKVWEAHKTHYYQRLVEAGWGHRKTVLAEYVLMAACAISALLLHRQGDPRIVVAGLAAWGLIYLLLALGVRRLERRGGARA